MITKYSLLVIYAVLNDSHKYFSFGNHIYSLTYTYIYVHITNIHTYTNIQSEIGMWTYMCQQQICPLNTQIRNMYR